MKQLTVVVGKTHFFLICEYISENDMAKIVLNIPCVLRSSRDDGDNSENLVA